MLRGILKKHNVELIEHQGKQLIKLEDRELFDKTMKKINLETPRSGIAHSMDDALKVQKDIGFSLHYKTLFTLGGTGGGVAYNIEEFRSI